MAEDIQSKLPEAAAKNTGKLVTRLLILAILIMVATPVITIVAFRAMSRDVIKPTLEDVKLTEVALPRVQVNVAGTNASRYAQIDVVVRISDPSMAELFERQSKTTPKGQIGRASGRERV